LAVVLVAILQPPLLVALAVAVPQVLLLVHLELLVKDLLVELAA
jgi:hypothetical protein